MKNILLIEEEIPIREKASDLLAQEGYKVLSVAQGKDGIQMAKVWMPDLILCDSRNGFEVLRELKKGLATRYIPFILLTSGKEKQVFQNALSMGADGYIQKPFETEEFFETIERSLLPQLSLN